MKHGFSEICTLFGTFGIEVCNIDECIWIQLSVLLSLEEWIKSIAICIYFWTNWNEEKFLLFGIDNKRFDCEIQTAI